MTQGGFTEGCGGLTTREIVRDYIPIAKMDGGTVLCKSTDTI